MALGFGCTPIDVMDLLNLIEKQHCEGGTGATNSNLSGAGLGSDAFLSLWPDPLHLKNPRSKRFVVVRPQRFPVWQSVVQGAGGTWDATLGSNLGFNLVFSSIIFVQITGADAEQRSKLTLTEDVLSVIYTAMKVVSAMQMWVPKDNDQNLLVREPCRLLDSGLQISPVNAGESWWCKASLDFECKFSVKLPSP